jgi:hypothetical protein
VKTLLTAGLTTLLLTACAVAPVVTQAPTIQPPATQAPSADSPSPTVSVTNPPSAAGPTPTVAATVSVAPTCSPSGAVPPTAALQLYDNSIVEGALGYWHYGNGCGAPPDIGLDDLPLITGRIEAEPVLLLLPGGGQFSWWHAAYADPVTGTERLIGEGGLSVDSPDDPAPNPWDLFDNVSFGGPPPGSWILRVRLSLAGVPSDVEYVWRATIGEVSGPPPDGRLDSGGGPPIAGRAVSWSYGNDVSPDLRPPALNKLPSLSSSVPGGDLEFALDGGDQFSWWQASYAVSAGSELVGLGGAGNPDPGEGETILFDRVDFRGPPQGSWYLQVQVSFPYWLGQATYAWHGEVGR